MNYSARTLYGDVGIVAVHRTFNPVQAGSIPARPTSFPARCMHCLKLDSMLQNRQAGAPCDGHQSGMSMPGLLNAIFTHFILPGGEAV